MPKAKPLTKVHTRSEGEHLVPSPGRAGRYERANSPRIVRGTDVGTRTDNVRGRYSSPDPRELSDIRNDPEMAARTFGRRNKHTAQTASLRKAK